MDITKEYYSNNYQEYIEKTFNKNMTDIYERFLRGLKEGSTILDIGFGSGRDSLYFKNSGYNVTSIDPIKEFCDHAKEIGLDNVINTDLKNFNSSTKFDAIWACASLLHLNEKELINALKKIDKMMDKNGRTYASFKYGEYSGIRDLRYFQDQTEESITKLLKNTNLVVKEMWFSEDLDNDTKWLNVILIKR